MKLMVMSIEQTVEKITKMDLRPDSLLVVTAPEGVDPTDVLKALVATGAGKTAQGWRALVVPHGWQVESLSKKRKAELLAHLTDESR